MTHPLRSLIDRALRPLYARFDASEERTGVRLSHLELQFEQLRTALGRVEARQLGTAPQNGGPLAPYEFKVTSQWGEDGIVAHLVRETSPPKTFIEFGVEDYTEAVTRFLVEHDNWTGLVMDSSAEYIQSVRSSTVAWRHNLKALTAFITRDNINELIAGQGLRGEIGLLAIDIDGVDWWVWQAIEVVSPVIVVAEYNHRFGRDLSVTIPYEECFVRGGQRPITYFGASLKALCRLGHRKGYAFVGCNSNGVNAFFVRRDRMTPALKELEPEEGFVAGSFTEVRDERGLFVPADAEAERLELLRLPLATVNEAGEVEAPSDLKGIANLSVTRA